MARRANDMTELIREAFRESGLSMKRLAEKSDSHYASIHGFLVTGRDLKLTTAQRVCAVLGLELRRTRRRAKASRKGV